MITLRRTSTLHLLVATLFIALTNKPPLVNSVCAGCEAKLKEVQEYVVKELFVKKYHWGIGAIGALKSQAGVDFSAFYTEQLGRSQTNWTIENEGCPALQGRVQAQVNTYCMLMYECLDAILDNKPNKFPTESTIDDLHRVMRLLAVLPFDSYNDTSAIPPEDELLLLRVHTSNYSADQVRKAEKILTEYYDGNLPFEVNKWIATIKPKAKIALRELESAILKCTPQFKTETHNLKEILKQPKKTGFKYTSGLFKNNVPYILTEDSMVDFQAFVARIIEFKPKLRENAFYGRGAAFTTEGKKRNVNILLKGKKERFDIITHKITCDQFMLVLQEKIG